MSFLDIEWSTFLGDPVELYRFVLGTRRFLYTSRNQDVQFNNELYSASAIKRGRVGIFRSMPKNTLEIEVLADSELAALFIGPPPDDVLYLTIYRKHRGDSEFIYYWMGRVTGGIIKKSRALLTCEPYSTSLKNPGLRMKYSTLCPYMLYDTDCRVHQPSFTLVTTVATVF